MWEQSLPAMGAMQPFRDQGGCFASKLCSHINSLTTEAAPNFIS